MQRVKNFIKCEISNWNRFELIFIFCIIPLTVILSIFAKDSIVATFSAVFGMLYTIIAGKGKISCYFFGMIGTLCYSYLSFKNALYGSLLLYLGYYFPMEIIGIFAWRKNLKKENNEIKKTFLSNKDRITLALVIIFTGFLSSFVLKYFNDQFPFLDSFILILSIAGMYLTVKRCIEQWIIWTITNFLSVIMWFVIFANGGRTFATLIMWLVYLFLGIYFFVQWKKELRE